VTVSGGNLDADFAEGSVEECRYFLILVKDLGYNA
jgi:hypothetical protein